MMVNQLKRSSEFDAIGYILFVDVWVFGRYLIPGNNCGRVRTIALYRAYN
jgi:hypothetical protein